MINLDELLQNHSLYDLFHLQLAIEQELLKPQRLNKIKDCLQVGQSIQYFNSKFNKLITANITKMSAQHLIVEHPDGIKWQTYYWSISFNDSLLKRNPTKELNRGNVAIGDLVGFKHNGQPISGKVVKLNPKTVKLITNTHQTWTVYYGHLYFITDVEANVSAINMIDI